MYTGKIDAKAIVNVFSPNDESYGATGLSGLNPSECEYGWERKRDDRDTVHIAFISSTIHC